MMTDPVELAGAWVSNDRKLVLDAVQHNTLLAGIVFAALLDMAPDQCGDYAEWVAGARLYRHAGGAVLTARAVFVDAPQKAAR